MINFRILPISCLAFFFSIASMTATMAVTVYDFGASWCAPCRADVQRDNELNALYKGRVKFVFVNEDVERDKADEFIRATNPNFEVRYDPDHSFARSLGATNATPSLVIDGGKGGRQVFKGSMSKERLKGLIDQALGS